MCRYVFCYMASLGPFLKRYYRLLVHFSNLITAMRRHVMLVLCWHVLLLLNYRPLCKKFWWAPSGGAQNTKGHVLWKRTPHAGMNQSYLLLRVRQK
jgi:hypothetical protein